jgi:uncharacterized delta-60 repeat protein
VKIIAVATRLLPDVGVARWPLLGPGACEDHVLAPPTDLEEGVFLRGVEREPARLDPREEGARGPRRHDVRTTTTTTQPTGVTPAPDAATPDAATPDAADASAPSAPIVAESAQRLPGALNPYGLAFGSDGHLYVSGATLVGGDRQLAVWRLDKATNKLDTTFGTNGVVTVPINGDETSYGLVELKDGSFVVHAVSNNKVWLAKLVKTGAAFAFDTPKALVFGWQDAEFPEWPVAGATPAYTSWGLALDKSQANIEKIVVFAAGAPPKVAAGNTQRTEADRWIARVLATDFTNDPGFNTGKPFWADGDGKNLADDARRGLVEADGSIVSAGYANFTTAGGVSVVLLRLKPDGTPDTTFGFGSTSPGQTKFNPFASVQGASEAYAVVKQSNGRYVTTGYGKSAFDTATVANDLLTFGVKPDGLDPTYGRLGAWAVQSETSGAAGLGAQPYRDNGRDLAVLPDDRTVQVGCYDDQAAVVVFDKNGKLDKSFAGTGILQYPHAAPFFKVAVSPDGKRVAASSQSVTDASLVVTLKVGN